MNTGTCVHCWKQFPSAAQMMAHVIMEHGTLTKNKEEI